MTYQPPGADSPRSPQQGYSRSEYDRRYRSEYDPSYQGEQYDPTPISMGAPDPADLIARAEPDGTTTQETRVIAPSEYRGADYRGSQPQPGYYSYDNPDKRESNRRSDGWSGSDWAAIIVLMLVSCAFVSLHVLKYTQLSPFGEIEQIDNTYKAAHFYTSRSGDTLDPMVVDEASCRGTDVGVPPQDPGAIGLGWSGAGDERELPPCGAQGDQRGQPVEAIEVATDQYPVYYFSTGLIARGLVEAGVFESFVVAARVVGGLWLGLALALIWYVLHLLSVRRARRSAILSVFIATPLVLFNSATVGPNAMGLLAGALIVLASVKVAARQWSSLWLLPIAIIVYAMQQTTALMLLLAMAFLLFDAIRNRRGVVSMIMPVLVTAGVVVVRWRYGQELHDILWPPTTAPHEASATSEAAATSSSVPTSATFPTPNTTATTSSVPTGSLPTDSLVDGSNPATSIPAASVPADGVTVVEPAGGAGSTDLVAPGLGWYANQVAPLFTPVGRAYAPAFMRSGVTTLAMNLANWLTIALSGIMALMGRTSARLTVFARLILFGCLIAGPLYSFYLWQFSDRIVEASGRFGLPLVAGLIVISGAAIHHRFTTVVTALVGAFGCVTSLYYLLLFW